MLKIQVATVLLSQILLLCINAHKNIPVN